MTHLIQLHEFDGGIHPPENKRQSASPESKIFKILKLILKSDKSICFG